MSATQLSLLGTFPVELFHTVIQRLSAATQSSSNYHAKETIWERGNIPISDDNRLRLRWECDEKVVVIDSSKGRSKAEGAWTMQVLQKSEPARLSPEFLSRSVIDLSIPRESGIDTDPSAMVSAMGYQRKFELCVKGIRFRKGAVVVEVYRLFPSLELNQPLDPTSYIVSMTNKLIPRPSNPAQGTTQVATVQDLKTEGMERMREMVTVLRGLVDLQRME